MLRQISTDTLNAYQTTLIALTVTVLFSLIFKPGKRKIDLLEEIANEYAICSAYFNLAALRTADTDSLELSNKYEIGAVTFFDYSKNLLARKNSTETAQKITSLKVEMYQRDMFQKIHEDLNDFPILITKYSIKCKLAEENTVKFNQMVIDEITSDLK